MRMILNSQLNEYYRTCLLFPVRQKQLSIACKISAVFCMALLTGLMAHMRFPVPGSPVPITGQTYAVLLSGLILGSRWGGISMLVYMALGFLGLPMFSHGVTGLSILFSPTLGYIIGFIFTALFVGHFTALNKNSNKAWKDISIMLFANFVIIHGMGLLWLCFWSMLVQGGRFTLGQLLALGTMPFIFGDILKVFLAAGTAKFLIKKRLSFESTGEGEMS